MIRSNTWKRSRHTSWKQLCWLASAGILWILFLYQVTVSISLECPDKYFQTLTELLLHLHARTHGAFLCISVCYPSSASLEKRLPDVLKYFLLIRSHPACSEQSLQEMLQTGLQTSMLPSGELTEIFFGKLMMKYFWELLVKYLWEFKMKYFWEFMEKYFWRINVEIFQGKFQWRSHTGWQECWMWCVKTRLGEDTTSRKCDLSLQWFILW